MKQKTKKQKPRKARAFPTGVEAWFYVDRASIDVYVKPSVDRPLVNLTITRKQLESALRVMKKVS